MTIRLDQGSHQPGEYETRLYDGPTRRHQQLIPATGEGRIGDCYRTCIACLVGADSPDEVPHFVEQRKDTGDDPWEDIRLARTWLRDHHGADLIHLSHRRAVELAVPYLATVQSKSGPWPHVLIGRRGYVEHDPSGLWFGRVVPLDDVNDVVEVLCLPYAPDPDELIRRWVEEAA